MEETHKHRNHVSVIGVGQACVDYLGRLRTFPEEDGKVELLDITVQCGGPASTALVTLSRLGIKTGFFGSISDDSLGEEIIKGLKEDNIDISGVKITPGYTSPFAFIAINARDGRRTIFWHRGSVPHLRAQDIDLGIYPNARILHVDSLMVEAITEAVIQAKQRGMLVVMDAGTLRDGIPEILKMVDVLIASEPFSIQLAGEYNTPEYALRKLKSYGSKEVVITLGKRGSVGLSNDSFIVQDAYNVQAVDTTGAGDVYHGAYIYGLIRGWPMGECMRFASAVSAIKCTKIGARRGIPSLEQVKRFMGDDFPE